jgi:hypothetical protein
MAMQELTARYAFCGYTTVETRITSVWYGAKYVRRIYVAFPCALQTQTNNGKLIWFGWQSLP